jgi:two-component system chemotaxis sensor kinase CheA
MDDLLQDFLTETFESLTQLDQDIVELEQNPEDPELLGNIFRVAHTIKGTCGFLDLPRLESVAHAAENILGKYRDGELPVTEESITLILNSVDRITMIVTHLEQKGEEPEGDDSDLINQIEAILEAGGHVEATEEELEAAFAEAETEEEGEEKTEQETEAAKSEGKPDKSEESNKAAKTTAQQANQAVKESQLANQSIRVNVDVLENLMTVVSELVLTRNQLLQTARANPHDAYNNPLQQLNHVVSELQEGVMKTRMQPIGKAWAKLPRLVRDTAKDLDKDITLVMEGEDTELDRQVLELIKDPLTHMVRNSADHGIEQPDERVEKDKPSAGTIHLSAYHEGGHIISELKDDGKGLAVDKIKAKALDSGVVSESDLENMSDQQIKALIFRPGFSTADAVTSVSGRGVGMDVVRSNIEKIGGTVDLKSVEGEGTTFTIKIPLTLAIVSAMILSAAGNKFALPQTAIVELVKTGRDSDAKIERIQGSRVLRLRGGLLPLVDLSDVLGQGDQKQLSTTGADEPDMESAETPAKEIPAEEAAAIADNRGDITGQVDENFIIVSQVGNFTFGIIVDQVFDTEEIVVKPVAPLLRDIDVFSGNTILGDGSVIMILDPNGMAKQAGDVSTLEQQQSMQAKQTESDSDKTTSLLLFTAGDGAPKAVPLALIGRLEDIDKSEIEQSEGGLVVQYRGQLMPLIPFSSDVTIDLNAEGNQPVLVFADEDKHMGLIVDTIVDIVEEAINVQSSAAQNTGVLGSAIVSGKATEVIDVSHFLNKATGDWFDVKKEDAFESPVGRHVLLVDDSPFFRNMIKPFLEIEGYTVTVADHGQAALDLQNEGKSFDLIISDIEMPGLSGFELAEKIRAGDHDWAKLPMIALSSHATPDDLERGATAGFDAHVAKFDRDRLLDKIRTHLGRRDAPDTA